MNYCRYLIVLLICLAGSAASAQKVKYKDIFGLLSTRQYDEAEPFLRQYLASVKDNPNAHLFMGTIYQESLPRFNVLREVPLIMAAVDSAVLFYDLALQGIDEREIKKNKEYYQPYNRRDLRTGEFGIKLSDIQFDIQKRKESLAGHLDRVKMVAYYFRLADSLYRKTHHLFETITAGYPSRQAFLLLADDSTLRDLTRLAVRFDSTVKFVERYQSSLETLGKREYLTTVTYAPIDTFGRDGVSGADFYATDLKLWDYRSFCDKYRATIQEEIYPMRRSLVDLDIKIQRLRDRLRQGESAVKEELRALADELQQSTARKFDAQALPLAVMSIKIADLDYQCTRLMHKAVGDTTNLHFQRQWLAAERSALLRLDSAAALVDDQAVERGSVYFQDYITATFNQVTVLENYVKGMREFAAREAARVEAKRKQTEASLQWLLAGSDSIPLFFAPSQPSGHRPLLIEDEHYTVGVVTGDTLVAEGYFSFIDASRRVPGKVVLPLDSAFARAAQAPMKALGVHAGEQVYYLVICLEEKQEEHFPATLAKVYRSDGFSWSVNTNLSFIPEEVRYDEGSGEVSVRSGDQVVTVDKNGRLKN